MPTSRCFRSSPGSTSTSWPSRISPRWCKKGEDFSRDDQQLVIAKEREILAKVLPAYAAAAQRGSIELSATPYYHPILPLLCDTNVGEQSAPGLSLPTRHFQRPEDASLQIQRALDSHQALFGVRPKGLWPSEGSVSEEAVMLAARAGNRVDGDR